MESVHRESAPFDRLTRLCNEMCQVLNAEQNTDVAAIIMLHDGENGAIETYRIEDENDLASIMLLHLKAIFASHGRQLTIMTDTHIFDLGGVGSSGGAPSANT